MDSLRGVERFARANPHLLPHLGLRNPPGHTLLPLLLHRLDPKKLQEALHQVFPEADLGGVLVVDGKHLRGSGKGKSPQNRLVKVQTLHIKTTLKQDQEEEKKKEKEKNLTNIIGIDGFKKYQKKKKKLLRPYKRKMKLLKFAL